MLTDQMYTDNGRHINMCVCVCVCVYVAWVCMCVWVGVDKHLLLYGRGLQLGQINRVSYDGNITASLGGVQVL